MLPSLEMALYSLSQWFLWPVLIAIALLFGHASQSLGACLMQAWQRHRGQPGGFELHRARQHRPDLDDEALAALALQRLQWLRIATRVGPMLGLVATMIPMGPAMKSLADGQLQDVSRSLMVAFSAVILALLAAALTHAVAQVRRRWYADDLRQLRGGAPA